ncbi:hypothetical protein IC235_17020 [Hymenobacter sp. BT664]|uniref:Imm33-like domain-containing protein n=1 Tax=Hymenobacter montanus TaxID=2771359 RepID=A0A927BGE7_9BACT|nr:hypothetical protein [Hymenobacter montanus]MBD2769593.1 hypothetical protein [Hymenobacter montanus]
MDFNTEEQKLICLKYNTEYYAVDSELKIGISKGALAGVMPLNGLRHPIEGDTSGWYIWGGEEFSDDPDFFLPFHLSHITEILPRIAKYLALPPGWRFLVAPHDYEDVWYEEKLLSL